MTLDEALRQARGALVQPPHREIPGVRVIEADALQALIEHAEAGSNAAAFVKRQAQRDQFAMHAPIEPIAFTNDLDSIGLKRRVALALAYADEMMRQTGRP